MLKIDEILKKLEEIDKVIKSVDEIKNKALIDIENISRKYSNEISIKIETIVKTTIEEYRNKAIEETMRYVDSIKKQTEQTKQKIANSYQEKKRELLSKALELLNL